MTSSPFILRDLRKLTLESDRGWVYLHKIPDFHVHPERIHPFIIDDKRRMDCSYGIARYIAVLVLQ